MTVARATIVIPAYDPTRALAALVAELSADGRPIVVVDDGSPARARTTFERVASEPGVTVLRHATNRGKGEALKTAFAYVRSAPAAVGVVTADADGQHLASDVRRVAEQLERSPSAFVLGTRTFDRGVPLANRAGNVAARGLFRLLVRRRIADTQTGLRGIPAAFLAELIEIEETRYDFELEMLVRAVARESPIVELPIRTVYGVTGQSHFQPLADSLRIVRVFARLAGRLSNARTDWDAYHRSPSVLSPLTRRVTARAIAATVRRFGEASPDHIVELGGGNSIFLRTLRAAYPDAQLTAIDTNVAALEMLRQQLPGDARLATIGQDVLAPVTRPSAAAIVFSVGLIEHFRRDDTARVIAAHFAHARPGGLVLMTYPTPTWLYRVVRRLAEWIGVWRFPDERPILAEEVLRETSRYGEILHTDTLWAIVLTQGLVAVRRLQS